MKTVMACFNIFDVFDIILQRACSMQHASSTYPGSFKTCFFHIPVFGGKVSFIFQGLKSNFTVIQILHIRIYIVIQLYVSTVSTYAVKTIRMAPYFIACSMQHVLTVSAYPGSCKTCFFLTPVFGRKVFLIFQIIYQIAHLHNWPI